jgi:hypothetical protein
MFGTLCAPVERPVHLRFGIGVGLNEQYQTLPDFYLRPLRNCFALLPGATPSGTNA